MTALASWWTWCWWVAQQAGRCGPGGVGKTRSLKDFTSSIDDVETQVFGELLDETWFYPGHGDDSTLVWSGRSWASGGRAVGDRAL